VFEGLVLGELGVLALKNDVKVEHELLRTPTANRDLTQRIADFQTLADGLDYAARGATGLNFYSGRGVLEHVLPYAELRKRALQMARKLLSIGLAKLDRVAIVAETGPDFVVSFFACQYAGLVPCPVPYSMYIGGKEAYESRIAGMLRAAHAHAVITPDSSYESLKSAAVLADVEMVLTHSSVRELPDSIATLHGFEKNDVAYIQYSSGSTSAPKGVLISQASIIANAIGILKDGMDIGREDRGFSWLPLYHDMGLVGFLLAPMLAQVSLDYLATTAFARRPALWLKLMAQNRSTISFSPSFGYDLAGRRINGEAVNLDLSAWRIAGIGGDMVRADVLQQFADHLKVAHFNPSAFMPSYGMAESTLAVSFAKSSSNVRCDVVLRAAVRGLQKAIPAEQGEAARSFVICGRPIAGHQIQVRNELGSILPNREIGRIFVAGPSLMLGYFENEVASFEAIGTDGFLDTGDMGYMLDGEIVITGRAKDLILHNGRNIWPQDIEWSAEQLPDLKAGEVAAFAIEGDDGDDEVVVLVECRSADPKVQFNLHRDVAKLVHQTAGVDCKIELVAPRSLPFTSSGKLSRAGARQKYLAGEIDIVSFQ
jgi:fatty-acyl-CoA synthase